MTTTKYKTKIKDQLVSEISRLNEKLVVLREESARRAIAEEELYRIDWLLKKSAKVDEDRHYEPFYGDLTKLNTHRTVLDSVGSRILSDLARDYVDLLDTSAAIYEMNGDYALGIFTSGWCRLLDQASRRLCDTEDNREALASGKWLCHESCWTDASKASIESGACVDIECRGGIHLYAVPIWSGGVVVGSMNVGCGDPPRETEKLTEIAKRYRLEIDELVEQARRYDSRPPFIIGIAKQRLESSARLVGEIISRREVENQLRETELLYRTLFEQSPDGVVIINPESGLPLAFNDVCCRQLGYSREEFKKVRISDYEVLETLQETRRHINQIHEGLSDTFETRHRTRDGGMRDVWVTVQMMDVSGMPAFHCIFRDITERKRAEATVRKLNENLRLYAGKLKDSNKELEAFSYSVSHDLRAPLRAIDGFSQVLVEEYDEKLDDEGRRVISVIRTNTRKMAHLIDDLLAMSRLGRCEMELMESDLSEIAREVFRDLHTANAGRTMRFEIGEIPPATGDPAMLRQVVANLLSNAVKFSREKELANIEVGGWSEGERNVYFVKDNGVGFDMKYAKKLFGVFQRLHREEEFEGTGVGLAIVKRIVTRHGGNVWAEGEEGKGATFYFSLPKQEYPND